MIGTLAFSKEMKPPCGDLIESELGIKYPNLSLSLSHPFMVPPLSKLRKPKGKGPHILAFRVLEKGKEG